MFVRIAFITDVSFHHSVCENMVKKILYSSKIQQIYPLAFTYIQRLVSTSVKFKILFGCIFYLSLFQLKKKQLSINDDDNNKLTYLARAHGYWIANSLHEQFETFRLIIVFVSINTYLQLNFLMNNLSEQTNCSIKQFSLTIQNESVQLQLHRNKKKITDFQLNFKS